MKTLNWKAAQCPKQSCELSWANKIKHDHLTNACSCHSVPQYLHNALPRKVRVHTSSTIAIGFQGTHFVVLGHAYTNGNHNAS